MAEAKERISPLEEFDEGFKLLMGGVYAYISDGSIDKDMVMSSYPYMRTFNENINKYLFSLQHISGLTYDVPCGTGYGTVILASSGFEIIGMDVDSDAIKMCAETIKYSNASFVEADMMDASSYKEAGRISSIVCLDGLEHVTPGDMLIKTFYDVLSPGGTLVISVPVASSLELSMRYNRFHMEDYDFKKFHGLIKARFVDARFFGVDYTGNISQPMDAFTSWIAVCKK